MAQRRALGRGLNALLGSSGYEGERLRDVQIERIIPGTRQPREYFDEERLDELAASIREHGLVQPVIARPLQDGLFQLIAGERRWRAAQRAGLERIPVIVREAEEHDSIELALVENLQREDLNPIEEARAYQRLIAEFGRTQDDVARRVGKNRSTIANILRLLKLPPEVQQWIRENRLSTGHAKALLSLSDLNAILASARKIIEGNYSVRQAESLVASLGGRQQQQGPRSAVHADPNVAAAVHALEQALGTKVLIEEHQGKGKIEIHFYSLDQLNRLYDALMQLRA